MSGCPGHAGGWTRSSPPVRVRSHERLEDFVLGVVVGGDDLPDVNLKQRGLLDFHTIGTAVTRRL